MSASWHDGGMLVTRPPAGRLLGVAGATMLAVGAALVGVLHLVAGGSLEPAYTGCEPAEWVRRERQSCRE